MKVRRLYMNIEEHFTKAWAESMKIAFQLLK